VAMSYWFRDSNNNYLQADGTVAPTFNTFSGQPDVIDAPNTTWSYEVVLPYQDTWKMGASSIDDAGQTDLRGTTRTWAVTTTGVSPTVAISTPVVMVPPGVPGTYTVPPCTQVTFAGTATDTTALTSVNVFLRNTTTHESLAADGSWSVNNVAGWYRVSPLNLSTPTYAWTYTSVPLSPGIYDFRVRATNSLGLTTPTANRGLLTVTVEVPGDAFPNGLLDFTGTDNTLQVLHLNLTGTATDDHGVAAVKLTLFDSDTNLYVQPDGTLGAQFATLNATLGTPGATSTTFALSQDLPSQGNYGVTAYAVDTAGQWDTSTVGATARYLVYPGDQPPTLDPNLGSPVDGSTVTGSHVVVSGRAIDDIAMASVRITITNSLGQTMNSAGVFGPGTTYVNAVLTSPGSPGSNFGYTSPTIPPGVYTISVVAVDNHGFVQLVPRVVTVTVTP
jgi:trimeric autotransporter adhesin